MLLYGGSGNNLKTFTSTVGWWDFFCNKKSMCVCSYTCRFTTTIVHHYIFIPVDLINCAQLSRNKAFIQYSQPRMSTCQLHSIILISSISIIVFVQQQFDHYSSKRYSCYLYINRLIECNLLHAPHVLFSFMAPAIPFYEVLSCSHRVA